MRCCCWIGCAAVSSHSRAVRGGDEKAETAPHSATVLDRGTRVTPDLNKDSGRQTLSRMLNAFVRKVVALIIF
jgi:hypothetical protein